MQVTVEVPVDVAKLAAGYAAITHPGEPVEDWLKDDIEGYVEDLSEHIKAYAQDAFERGHDQTDKLEDFLEEIL